MQTATSEMESKSLDLSVCVHHYTLRAPCPKGQGMRDMWQFILSSDFPMYHIFVSTATHA